MEENVPTYWFIEPETLRWPNIARRSTQIDSDLDAKAEINASFGGSCSLHW